MTGKESYQDRVFDVCKMIPAGRVSTYGAISNFLDLGSARMVGWALNKCIMSNDPVPAHRVVNRKGELSGRIHFAHPDLMAKLLNKEGVVVMDNKVQNFEVIKWDPSKELY